MSEDTFDILASGGTVIQNIAFSGEEKNCIYLTGAYPAFIVKDCTWSTNIECAISAKASTGKIYVEGNQFLTAGKLIESILENPSLVRPSFWIVDNRFQLGGGRIYLDDVDQSASTIIRGNMISSLTILKQDEISPSTSHLIYANTIHAHYEAGGVGITLGENTEGWFVTGNMLWDVRSNQNSAIVDQGINNIIRFNSDDPGGSDEGSGGVAGVSKFNGRTGAVIPQNGDYTAEMVGAIPAGQVKAILSVTQAQYDALTVKDAATLYLIKE